MRTFHPNPERLVLLSKIAKGVPKFKHPQDIEKCSDCLIAKLRKAARGKAPVFTAVSLGQGLAIDFGFMFQRSKTLPEPSALPASTVTTHTVSDMTSYLNFCWSYQSWQDNTTGVAPHLAHSDCTS
jgi:hypothetical protein